MAGLVSPSTLEQIRAASDIVEVIGACVPLKRAGANFVALCPFHKEKTPSFNVNPQRQIFHCFGCHKGGDVFTFIREYENIGFTDAVQRLAERARIPLTLESHPGQAPARHLKDTLLQIHEQIAQRWQSALANEAAGEIAREYLARRGVPDEAVKLFRLGYAPDVWDDTVNWAKSKGHEPALMEQAGLIIRKEGADHHYDRFRGRLIFPICDEQGRVIGFSGRILSGDEKTAKYVNSPETPIFTKGKVFYGLDKSKRAILDAGCAIICEGQLDLIACFMAGVKQVVAPQGTAFTSDHARILKRYTDEVVLCFDSDAAGQAAAVRVLDSLLASSLAIRVATIPAPHDPDSYIRETGGAAFQQLIDRAEGFFDYYLNRLCAENNISTDKGRLAVVKAMAEAVHKTGNLVLADTYAQKTAARLGVATDAMRLEFKRASRAPTFAAKTAGETEPESERAARPAAQEFWLLKLLLGNDDQVDWVSAHLEPGWISHHAVREIVTCRLEAHARQAWQGVAALLDDIEDETARSLITEALTENQPVPNAQEVLRGTPTKQGLVELLRNQFLDRQVAVLIQRMSQPELGEPQRLELLQQQQTLRRTKHQPLRALAAAQ